MQTEPTTTDGEWNEFYINIRSHLVRYLEMKLITVIVEERK
jgi:hypothetical protein